MEPARSLPESIDAPPRHRLRALDPAPDGAGRAIGVLTLHRCINYGSYWQARALVEGLRGLGHDTVIVDHLSWGFNRAEWLCGVSPLLPARSSVADSARYGLKIARFSRARASLPRSPRFPLERPSAMRDFDVVVVGSDEVWNLAHPMYGACPLFFGDGVRADRLISYAASFGSYDAGQGIGPEWADRLRAFDQISVRDANSRHIVAEALGEEPRVALDPCLQFPIEPRGPWRGPGEPFIAVYGHSFSPGFGRRVRRAAKARGLPLLSIGYRNDWADEQWLTAAPDDFAHAMGRAEAVATNFFHGCIFALREDKPFACEASPYRSNKINGLLAMLDAEAHLLSDDAPAAERLLSEKPERSVIHRIERLRRDSGDYLRRALA